MREQRNSIIYITQFLRNYNGKYRPPGPPWPHMIFIEFIFIRFNSIELAYSIVELSYSIVELA